MRAYTTKEERIIKHNYPDIRNCALSCILKRSTFSIAKRAKLIGVSKSIEQLRKNRLANQYFNRNTN